ncbi:MAG: L,D-transpeptidase family protein, partial [Crocinitomicaceae bacterium]
MTRFLFLLLTLLLFNSCNSEDNVEEIKHVDNSFLNDPSITDKEKFSRALDPRFLNSLGMNSKQQEAVISFYKENAFKFKYYVKDSITKFGSTVEKCLSEPLQFGVPKSRLIELKKNNHWIEKEILMTSNLLSMVGVLKNGLIDFEQKKMKELIPLDGKEFYSQLKQLDTIPLSKFIIKQGSIDTNYQYLAQHLYDFCQNYPLDTHTYSLKSKKEDTLNFEKNIKACLVSKGFLNNKATDLEFKKAVKKFKLYCGFNEDSNIDDATLQALNESTYTKVVRASISLDKIRQRPANEKKFVRVNLPSFELFYVADDKLRSRNRIIIGKTSNQTPEFKATINRIVCYPFWKVPQSIANKEIFPAVKANSNYL